MTSTTAVTKKRQKEKSPLKDTKTPETDTNAGIHFFTLQEFHKNSKLETKDL